jgi:diadenosine tetraphosphate (Ap4A) HIT family hydrolase
MGISSPFRLIEFGARFLKRAGISRPDTDPACVLCLEVDKAQLLGAAAAMPDAFPVAQGHMLIVPRRHVADYFSMTSEERRDSERLLLRLRDQLLQMDPTIKGFNIGVNCGAVAGQTIDHAHTHLIPRRLGDTAAPAGGVRGVIPERMTYQRLQQRSSVAH